MLENQTAQPAPDTGAGSQTASAPSENLDDALSRVYDELQKPASEPAADITLDPAAKADEPTSEVTTDPSNVGLEPIKPPHSWTADKQKWFASLSRQHQEYIAKREADTHQKITTMGPAAKAWEPLRKVYDEYRQWVQPGAEAEVTRNLLAAQAMIDRDPVRGIAELARAYQLKPEQVAQSLGYSPTPEGRAPQNATQEAIDDLFRDPRLDKEVMPVVQTLQQQNAELRDRLARMEQGLSRRESLEVSARQRAVEGTIVDFARDKADWGDVAEEVVGEVALLKQQNPGADAKQLLEQAYERARWKNPDVRTRILADQRKAEEAKAAKEVADAASKAKKMAGMNVRTGASASTATFDGRWDDSDHLSELFDRIQSR